MTERTGGRLLCPLDQLSDPGARGFSVPSRQGMQDIFVVRMGARVFAYLNSCPHTGGPLDWVPDQFLDLDGAHIQCATHDARFTIDSGRCVSGPCVGAALSPVAVRVEYGRILLNESVGDDL